MRRPNILLITTDQQRWDTIGANGNPEIITPNLDRLVQSGTTFDHHFVQHPLCMPSRISMLAGQYPATLKITHMGVPVPQGLSVLPHFLKTYGYHTANIGKLHFLPHSNRDHRVPHPSYGFDHLEIADEPGVYEDAYRAWVRRKKPEQVQKISAGLPPATHVWQQTMGLDDGIEHPFKSSGRSDFKRAIPFPADDDLTHSAFVAEQTIEYLRQRDPDQPFLCIAAFYSPHAPWMVPQTYLDMYDPDTLSLPSYPPGTVRPASADEDFSDAQLRRAKHGYYAMVTEVDYHVGRIIAALQAEGLADDTIIVFTSDHGEWLGDHLRYGKGYPGEDSVSRVPLIIRVPGADSSGVRHEIIQAVDLLPTLMDLIGVQTPPHLQGRSYAPLLLGRDYVPRESALMEANGWKNLRTERYRYVIHDDGGEFLWDIQNDPGEYHNLADNPAAAEALATCRHLMLRHLLEIERPLPRTFPY